MFGLDDVAGVADDVLGGTPWGWGVAAVAAVALIGGRQAKPLAKGAIKGYFAVTRVTRQWAAEAGEQIQDLYAEARHEYESQASGEAADVPDLETRPRRRTAATPSTAGTEAIQPA